MSDDHLARIRSEFDRQSATFEAYADRLAPEMDGRFRDALGDAGRGEVLDVACGPGAVAVALGARAGRVTGLDTTEAMLGRARRRAADAGLTNARFIRGEAEALPFADASFDAVVTRAALHHFADSARVLAEMFRVLRHGGRAVVVDVVSSEQPGESELHNALEILRDPSHVRMLRPGEMDRIVAAAGFCDLHAESWDHDRELDEWLAIVNDPARVAPLRSVMRALADSGAGAGIDLRVEDGAVRFRHRWRLVAAGRP